MFGFFKKKKEKFMVVAPTKGKLTDLGKVKDPVFAQKMMGDGFAIEPNTSAGEIDIVAPVSGKIVSLPSSKHAVGIHMDDGVDVLVHIGIDTVNLKGKGFTALAKQGDRVEHGQSLIRVDPSVLKQNNLDDTVMTIFTGGYDQKVNLSQKYGTEINEDQELIG